MAQITNFGKAWLQSMALRLNAHPSSFTINDFQMEAVSGYPALHVVLMSKAYFDTGIDVDHATLSLAVARTAGCVYGYGTHATGTPWYTGNALRLGPQTWLPPDVVNGSDTSTVGLLTGINITFSSGHSYSPAYQIGGFALCLSNASGAWQTTPNQPIGGTTAGATQVVAYYNFTGSPNYVEPTGPGQTLSITGSTVILSEA
jgi:hypothetical protein